MKLKSFSILIFYLTFISNSSGQQSELNKILDSIFSSLTKNSPGVAVSVIQNGNVIARKDYGMASIELGVPFSHQTVVRIGYSEAREFISIAALLMEKDGILNMNDKVRKYYPKLPAWSEPVTIWDLLNHRSGFVDEWATLLLMHGAMSNRFDEEQFFQLLYSQPDPQIEPGKGYLYCNSDFGLLRLIMEKASGKKLPDWIKQRIFDPLKMDNTRMQKNPLDIVPNQAIKYSENGNAFEHDNVQKTSPGGNYFILTSADDLTKWSMAINTPGSEFNAAFNTLLANVRIIPGKKNHYVTGYSIDAINGHRVIFHEGVNGETYLSRIPSKGISIITLGNLNNDGFSKQNKMICDHILQAKKPLFIKPVFVKQLISISEAELKKYEGRYHWLNQVSWESYKEKRKVSDVFVENGKLKIRYSGNYIIEPIPVGKDIFYYEEGFGAEIKFSNSQDGTPMRMTVNFDDGYPSETMEREQKEWNPLPAELKLFTGEYYSSHLGYNWNLELNEQGKIVLKRATMPDVILEPDGENQFHYIAEKSPGAGFDQWILFNKNTTEEITGFTVWSARVVHHHFTKK